MITPQETAQYGQVLRVSVVRAILNCRISARARDMSKPIPTAAPPSAAPLRNVRRLMGPPDRPITPLASPYLFRSIERPPAQTDHLRPAGNGPRSAPDRSLRDRE